MPVDEATSVLHGDVLSLPLPLPQGVPTKEEEK